MRRHRGAAEGSAAHTHGVLLGRGQGPRRRTANTTAGRCASPALGCRAGWPSRPNCGTSRRCLRRSRCGDEESGRRTRTSIVSRLPVGASHCGRTLALSGVHMRSRRTCTSDAARWTVPLTGRRRSSQRRRVPRSRPGGRRRQGRASETGWPPHASVPAARRVDKRRAASCAGTAGEYEPGEARRGVATDALTRP